MENVMKFGRSKMGSLFITSLFVVGAIATTESAIAAVNSETKEAATRSGAADVAEVSFSKTSISLTNRAKKQLQDAIATARKNGEIKEVKVAAWADQEYPAQGVSLADRQVDLAEHRAEAVQTYLKESLNISTVSLMNMAKRPSGVQNLLSTPNAQAKNALENTGAAPTDSSQTGLFGLKGKKSEALIMIYYTK